MPRFFVDSPPDGDGIIEIAGDDARHIALSLRSPVGGSISVCCGGVVYECELLSVRPERVSAHVVSSREDRSELPCAVSLFVANPKKDKLESVIQKATELGARRIVPFLSERCVSRPDPASGAHRRARWERIALEAAKQCGRGAVPEVADIVDMRSAVAEAAAADVALFVYEGEKQRSLKEAIAGRLERGVTVSVMTGPEGGFSPAEARAAESAGMIPCGLGERILRCETAPVYVLSAISYEAEL